MGRGATIRYSDIVERTNPWVFRQVNDGTGGPDEVAKGAAEDEVGDEFRMTEPIQGGREPCRRRKQNGRLIPRHYVAIQQ
jgi:hypothetical protein